MRDNSDPTTYDDDYHANLDEVKKNSFLGGNCTPIKICALVSLVLLTSGILVPTFMLADAVVKYRRNFANKEINSEEDDVFIEDLVDEMEDNSASNISLTMSPSKAPLIEESSMPSLSLSFSPTVATSLSPTDSPSSAPTDTLTIQPSTTSKPTSIPSISYADFASEIIIQISGTSRPFLKGTPQNLAREWLLEENTENVIDEERVIQQYSLATFFHAFSGDNWRNNDKFLVAGYNECEWVGVTCDENGYVTELNYEDNNLQGTIPLEVSHLSHLNTFAVKDDYVAGRIPEELGNLTDLRSLVIQSTNIYGTIPTSLGYLKKLRQLSLGDNFLTGTLPSTMIGMERLVMMELHENFLTGELDESIGIMTSLKHLDIHGNNFTERIPSDIGKLEDIEVLDLSDNFFDGTIPEEIMNLGKLENLNLGENLLRGTLTQPNNATLWKSFSVKDNYLNGNFPTFVGDLRNLEYLHLDENAFSGLIPDSIKDLDKIIEFTASSNAIKGSAIFPGGISLRHYSLRSNFIDKISLQVGKQRSLELLDVGKNVIEAPIPSVLGKLVELKRLDLSQNKIIGTIPEEMGQLVNLRAFDAKNNLIEGSIPSEFANLYNLVNLRLQGNLMSGNISTSFCNMKVSDLHEFVTDCGYSDVTCECCTHCCNISVC